MPATQIRSIAGALESLDAAAQQGTDIDLADLTRDLRTAVGELLDAIGHTLDTAYQRLDGDDAIDENTVSALREDRDNFINEVGQFVPALGHDDPYRPNPQTQPGDPNPVATPGPAPTPGADDNERGDRNRDDKDAGKTGKK